MLLAVSFWQKIIHIVVPTSPLDFFDISKYRSRLRNLRFLTGSSKWKFPFSSIFNSLIYFSNNLKFHYCGVKPTQRFNEYHLTYENEIKWNLKNKIYFFCLKSPIQWKIVKKFEIFLINFLSNSSDDFKSSDEYQYSSKPNRRNQPKNANWRVLESFFWIFLTTKYAKNKFAKYAINLAISSNYEIPVAKFFS